MNKTDKRESVPRLGTMERPMSEKCHETYCAQNGGYEEAAVPMIVHVRPDLYRAFMRCVWMLIHEEGMSPLEAQNVLIEDFLRHHGC